MSMKKQAQLGQWKTPPNTVYAQQHEQAHPPAAASASLGTKMQLMGLVKKSPLGLHPATTGASLPPGLPAATVRPTTSDTFSAGYSTGSKAGGESFVFDMDKKHAGTSQQTKGGGATSAQDDPSHFKSRSASGSESSEEYQMSPSLKRDDSYMDQSTSPGSEDRKSPLKRPSGGSPVLGPLTPGSMAMKAQTPEDKQKMLAHSRTMARLRRQQQRVLTDSLEAEFFELCVSAAYLRAALSANPYTREPLHSDEVDMIYQQATERSLDAMSSNIPAARSQELKHHAVSNKSNMPQAHFVPSMSKMDEATGVYLAVTVGSRRESLSFSTERRKGALAWSTSGVKNVLTELNKDALPAMLATNCAEDDASDVALASRLRLTPSQRESLMRVKSKLRGDVAKVVASQRAADMLFTDSWLSLPKTDGFMEQVRDTTTTEQMSKLISWSISNEPQIANLKLGSIGVAATGSGSLSLGSSQPPSAATSPAAQ